VVAVGNLAVQTIYDWVPESGSVVSWQPSPAALAKIRQAPISAVPTSYMQAQHIRGYCEHAAQGRDMSRLLIAAWDIPVQCDIRAMTYVLNAHLRRHDTFHSWFEFTDEEHIIRRTIREPADIALIPTKHGDVTPAEWQNLILATPDPLQWDCFRFLVIQRADHFRFCLCIDHLNIDAMFVGVAFTEIHLMYTTLVGGRAPFRLPEVGSYHDYCVRQHRYTSALTVNSPEVRAWIEFFEINGGTLPRSSLSLGDGSLSLGDGSVPCDLMAARLMDERQTARFESACLAAGARFCGGVLACAALAEHELTGAETYYGITPVDIRRTPADFMTTGWFIGFVPTAVPVASSFSETARAAQASFDSGSDLANVPLDRVLELAPWLDRPQRGAPLLFYLDVGIPPLSAMVNSHLAGLNASLYYDGGTQAQIDIRVNRLEKETQVIVLFPNNPVARASVTRYITALKSVYVRVAEGRDVMAPLGNALYG
jgi:mycolipenoyl-CoA---2-(long-chain-fatty acyl)-trehalose mycolipenoyltransferase / long-chain-acyl-CoA---trehalose acyltransferase